MTTADEFFEDVCTITEFSPAEGEPFRDWPAGVLAVLAADNWLLKSKVLLESPIYEKKIMIGEVILHAFRTSDGREWDAINGWRTK